MWPLNVLNALVSAGWWATRPRTLSPFGRPSRFGNGCRGSGGIMAARASPMLSGQSAGASGGNLGPRRGTSGVAATVDPDDLSGDVARFVAHQERGGGR